MYRQSIAEWETAVGQIKIYIRLSSSAGKIYHLIRV